MRFRVTYLLAVAVIVTLLAIALASPTPIGLSLLIALSGGVLGAFGHHLRRASDEGTQFRFGIRNIALGTICMALWGTVLVNYPKPVIDYPDDWLLIPMWLGIMAGPFIAIGAFFDRIHKGAIFGAGIAAVLFLLRTLLLS